MERNKNTLMTDFEDPTPDIHGLFCAFNVQYFNSKLDSVQVSWSTRMTLCAGLCYYEKRGKYCRIKLSEPLLKFRPRSDLIDTLLHEMIHAYLFVTENNTDHDGHGTNFQSLMRHINEKAGTTITIYHNFRDEVAYYKKHIWRCTGSCRDRPPFFGWVKRSMNRPPQPADRWWNDHKNSCSGVFIKLQSPPAKEKKTIKRDKPNMMAKKNITAAGVGRSGLNGGACSSKITLIEISSDENDQDESLGHDNPNELDTIYCISTDDSSDSNQEDNTIDLT